MKDLIYTPVAATPEQMTALSEQLLAVGERLEKAGSPDWNAVTKAALLLEGYRLSPDILPEVQRATH